MPGITIPSFALSSLTLYLENRIPLTFLSTLFRASENSLKSLTLNFIPREAHPDLLLAALPVVAPNLNFLSITNTTAQLVACLESCTKLKTMQLQPQSTIASLRVLLKTSPTSTLPPSLEELSLDSSEGGLVQRVKVLLEAQKESVLPRIYLINARITSTLVAKVHKRGIWTKRRRLRADTLTSALNGKPYIDELRSNGAIVVVV